MMSKKKNDNWWRGTIRKLHAQRATYAEMGRAIGVSRQRAQQMCKLDGLQLYGIKGRRRITQEKLDYAHELLMKGATLSEAVAAAHISVRAMRRHKLVVSRCRACNAVMPRGGLTWCENCTGLREGFYRLRQMLRVHPEVGRYIVAELRKVPHVPARGRCRFCGVKIDDMRSRNCGAHGDRRDNARMMWLARSSSKSIALSLRVCRESASLKRVSDGKAA
ncbi:MAG: hypothetical protein KGL39_45825 [Patescibacteria group bacterium]|nr:hypothetical protein [Patescibacteria group bacterium]